MNDISAVKELKNGKTQAFQYLFTKYYKHLVAFLMTYNHDKMQADDLAQQAFIKLWEEKHRLDDKTSPKNYLFTIAYHLYIDTLKKESRRNELLYEIWQQALSEQAQEDPLLEEERLNQVRDIIDSLPSKCKTIYQMNKMQGLKYKDIAKTLGISVKTVESQMRIAFLKIKDRIKTEIHI
ncbi:DNA-directed RNA polymerase sigma-70 factor [Echinicola pacifica]|uniref:DNA-directed RNA polymerase sigma-70 factor n=1 Tax=Echinicola pacifica TaxID=346377 RepID=A0A918PQD0_9BACT|nr:RNA polymerase sigma-70 factor [Echinicola pacifica]GGZ16825.1 DNA-directed RNA polymerase sigma-70 factor [Echinicola pacifica]